MVLLVKTKNNTDALKAINIARQTLNITHPKTIKKNKIYLNNANSTLTPLTDYN